MVTSVVIPCGSLASYPLVVWYHGGISDGHITPILLPQSRLDDKTSQWNRDVGERLLQHRVYSVRARSEDRQKIT